MVENNKFSDMLSLSLPPAVDTDHDKALQSLQSEVEYHRQSVASQTYLDKAVFSVYDGGQSESLGKIEQAYKNEKENPNSFSRAQVTDLVRKDQSLLLNTSLVDYTAGIANTALAIMGPRGKIAASALIALDTIHPNDTSEQQVLEGIGAAGLASVASHAFNSGFGVKNEILNLMVRGGAYPVASMLGREQWPHSGIGPRPNVDKIYETPTDKVSPLPVVHPRLDQVQNGLA